jgi:hypothetical protein
MTTDYKHHLILWFMTCYVTLLWLACLIWVW